MNKICILISGYPRDNARVFHRQAKSLLSFGFNVSILTNDGGIEENVEGIDIYCTEFWSSRLKILLFAKKQFLTKSFHINADVYFIHSPELLSLGLLLKAKGKKVVYDAHEDLPRHILEKEWLPRFSRLPISFFSNIYLNFVFERIDALISPHNHIVERYKSINRNCILITNFSKTSSDFNFDLSEYLSRHKIICYSGTAYFHSNQIQILDSINDFEDVIYNIAGTIPEKLYLDMQGHTAFSKVNFFGLIGYDRMKDFYQKARIGLVIIDYRLNLGSKMGTFAVNKMFEYMESGLPIVCSDYDLWIQVIEKYNCGLYVKPGNVFEIKKAINFLLENPALAYEMGQNGIKAVHGEYNWNNEEIKMKDLFVRFIK
jgi:glycosyltransferase involved in cell wall biosynthesis